MSRKKLLVASEKKPHVSSVSKRRLRVVSKKRPRASNENKKKPPLPVNVPLSKRKQPAVKGSRKRLPASNVNKRKLPLPVSALLNNSNRLISSNNSKPTTSNRPITNNRITNSLTTRLVHRVLEFPLCLHSRQPLQAVPTSP